MVVLLRLDRGHANVAIVRLVLKLLGDGGNLGSTHLLLGGRLLGSGRWLGDFGGFGFVDDGGFAFSRGSLDVEGRVAGFEDTEAFLDRVDFGVCLGCDLGGVDLRSDGE